MGILNTDKLERKTGSMAMVWLCHRDGIALCLGNWQRYRVPGRSTFSVHRYPPSLHHPCLAVWGLLLLNINISILRLCDAVHSTGLAREDRPGPLLRSTRTSTGTCCESNMQRSSAPLSTREMQKVVWKAKEIGRCNSSHGSPGHEPHDKFRGVCCQDWIDSSAWPVAYSKSDSSH